MTVLLVSEPGADGVFRYVESLAHFLVGHGVGVHLAYSDRRGSEALQELVDYVRQQGGETLNLAIANLPAPADVRAWFALRSLVRRVRPDVIHSHSSKAGVLARTLPLLGVRNPQIYQPHAYAGMRQQSRAARLLYDGIEHVLGRFSFTINCSPDELAYARGRLRLPPGRTVCISNGVDPDWFTPPTAAQKAALRRTFGLPAEGLVLGSLGRASPQKDPLTLYRAFELAAKTEPDVTLFHLGQGELDPQLNHYIHAHGLKDRVVRRAYLANPVNFYRAVDGFILTSQYEGLSLAALEAMACDLPLILSDAPGNHGLLELPLSHLWSAPIRDVDGFARGIRAWAARCRRGPAGRPSNHRLIARDRFDNRKNLLQVPEVYRRVCPSFLPLRTAPAPRAAIS